MSDPENFEVTLRVFGTELIGFKLSSQSSRKMWVVIGTLIVVVVGLLSIEVTPIIQQFL